MAEYTVLLRDRNLNLVAQIYPSQDVGISSVKWSRLWRDVGVCEITAPRQIGALAGLLTLGNYIEIQRDGVFEAIYTIVAPEINFGILRYAQGGTDHANTVYAAGQGEGQARELIRRKQQPSIDLLGRLEHYQDARDVALGDLSSLAARADAVLGEMGLTSTVVADVGHPVEAETLVVRAVSPAYLLKRRLILPPSGTVIVGSDTIDITGAEYHEIVAAADVAMRELVTRHLISPLDAERAVASLALDDTILSPPPGPVIFRGRFQSVLDGLQEIAAQTALGFEIIYNTQYNRLDFRLIPRRDRSVASAGAVVFSDEDTLLDVPGRAYRSEWDVGDLITVRLDSLNGQLINYTIHGIQITLEAEQADQVQLALDTTSLDAVAKLAKALSQKQESSSVLNRTSGGGGISSLIHSQTKHAFTDDEDFGGHGIVDISTIEPAARSPIFGVADRADIIQVLDAGRLTRTSSFHALLNEENAPVGSLSRVEGIPLGSRDLLVIRPARDDQSIIVKCADNAGAGNITTRDGLDRTLIGTDSMMGFWYDPIRDRWIEFGQSGLHEAVPDLAFKEGAYDGDGLAQFIPTGFTPKYVEVKGIDATATEGAAVVRIDQHQGARGMTTGSDCRQALTIVPGGFRVDHGQVAPHKTNKDGIRYIYKAFAGNNCRTGTYDGTGVDDRTVSTPFSMQSLWVQADQVGFERPLRWHASPMGARDLAYDAAAARTDAIKSVGVNSFTLGTYDGVNALSPLCFDQGYYVGNGATQDIAVDFDPKAVVIKIDLTSPEVTVKDESTGVICTPDTGGARSLMDGGLAANNSVALGSAGTKKFSVSYDSAHVFNTNVSGQRYIWYAVGGSAVRTGTYTGNGSSQSINTGAPDFPEMIWIVPSTGPLRYRTSSHTGANSSNFGSLAHETTGITSRLTNGFAVSGLAAINTNLIVYPYVTFDAAANLVIGSYVGNGLNNRNEPGFSPMAFDPDVVHIKGSSTQAAVFRTEALFPQHQFIFRPSLRYDNAAAFSSGWGVWYAQIPDHIKEVRATPGQFRIGTTAEVNTASAEYHFFCLKAAATGVRYVWAGVKPSSNFAVGSYLGTNPQEDNRNLPATALTFDPNVVHIKGNLAQEAIFRVSALSIGDVAPAGSLQYYAGGLLSNRIQALAQVAGKYEVGTDNEVNEANVATTYYYYAVKSKAIMAHAITDVVGRDENNGYVGRGPQGEIGGRKLRMYDGADAIHTSWVPSSSSLRIEARFGSFDTPGAEVLANSWLCTAALGLSTIRGRLRGDPSVADRLEIRNAANTDLGDLELLSIILGFMAGDPASPTNGQVWYNSTTSKARLREGGVSKDVVSGGGGSALTVQEEDGAPSDTAVTVLKFPNGTLTDNGVGDVSYVPTSGGGSANQSAAYVVATNNPAANSASNADTYANADFQCDGTDDHIQIQAALDAAPIDGTRSRKKVVIAEGVYNITAPITMDYEDLILECHGLIRWTTVTGQTALISVNKSNCHLYTPRLEGSGNKGNGVGIHLYGDGVNEAVNGVFIYGPRCGNLDAGILIDIVGTGSVGDCTILNPRITESKTGVLSRGFVNRVMGGFISSCNVGVHQTVDRSSGSIHCSGLTINQWANQAVLVERGKMSVFRDMWLEHTGGAQVPTEAIKIGHASHEVVSCKFLGVTNIHTFNELYAVKLVRSRGLRFDEMLISTNDPPPSTAIIREEATNTGLDNRIEKVTFYPSTIPAHTMLSLAGTGEVIVERVPVVGEPAGSSVG